MTLGIELRDLAFELFDIRRLAYAAVSRRFVAFLPRPPSTVDDAQLRVGRIFLRRFAHASILPSSASSFQLSRLEAMALTKLYDF